MIGERMSTPKKAIIKSNKRLTKGVPLGNNLIVIMISIVPN
jgi:hypothetical protein